MERRYTNHFFVSKDVDLSVVHEQKYPRVNEYELQRSDYPHSLVVGFKLDWLLEALEEVNKKTSVSSLKGFASTIAKNRKNM